MKIIMYICAKTNKENSYAYQICRKKLPRLCRKD
jgi:hypothetical protein